MNRQTFKRFGKCAAFLSILSTTSPAFAFFDAEVSGGKRSGTWKSEGTSGKTLDSTSIQVAGHLDPIPLVPVSFGIRVISDSYEAKIADHGIKSLSSTSVVPEVGAWIPLGSLRPFARVGYTAYSGYKGTAEATINDATVSGDAVFKSTGPRLAVGLEWGLLPLIQITGAYEYSSETVSVSSGKVGTIELKDVMKDMTYTSSAILVGVKAGL